jgi:hypothetical protein
VLLLSVSQFDPIRTWALYPATQVQLNFLRYVLSFSPAIGWPKGFQGDRQPLLLTRTGTCSGACPQNSFGPGRSCLEVQVIRIAAAIIRAIPATLMTTCIAMVLENWDRITKPINDSKTPRQ